MSNDVIIGHDNEKIESNIRISAIMSLGRSHCTPATDDAPVKLDKWQGKVA